jgi:hypothetical protein
MTRRTRSVAILFLLFLDVTFVQSQLHHFKVEAAGGGTIARQKAGVAFGIRITAQQANNTTYSAFTGKVKITSTGVLSAGADSTAKFVAGILTSHNLTVANSGVFTITAMHDSSGTSNAFPVIAFRSDDFNAANLNRGIWTFSDPVGDATLLFAGTKTANARLSLSVPAGVSHDLFTGKNTAPRILQPASDADFTLDVKFDSPVSEAYQVQGVLVQQSATVLLRFDFSSDGTATKAYAGSTSDGFATAPVAQIPPTVIAGNNVAPLYMRIQRSGSSWTMLYSTNGTSYVSAGTFSFVLTVSRVGAFAANAGSTIPAHTALLDYFFDAAQPVTPEDGGTVADTLSPLIYDMLSIAGATDIRVTWRTDERSKSRFEYGKTTSYGTTVLDDTLRTYHSVMLRSLTNNTRYNFRIIATDSTGRATTTANQMDTTFAKVPTVITPWYGTSQVFGKIGTPQRYVNILGNVSDLVGIDSMYYRLNGGAPVQLSWGPDARRLQRPGDFNIDIPFSTLLPGPNTVLLTTRNIFGEAATSTITVRDSSAAVWPLPFAVAMTSAKSLSDSVQVVDGRWTVASGFVQMTERGYDRILAVGDTTWKDYETSVRLKVTGIDTSVVAYNTPSNGPGIGILMRWAGHTNDPNPGKQPLEGYLPLGASATLSWTSASDQRWDLFGNSQRLQDTKTSPTLQFDTLYIFKMQVATITGQGGYYRFKVWKASQPEPTAWLMSAQEGLTDPQNGSMLLVAHHINCSIDHITVTALPADHVAPSLSGISTESSATSVFVTFTSDEPARVLIHYGPTSAYGNTAFVDTVLRVSHGIPITGLNPGTTYHYSIVATDNAGNAFATPDASVTAAPPATSTILAPDDFNLTVLNARWSVVNPVSDATIATPDTVVTIAVPAGVAHDLWTNGYGVPRLMQAANNTDFTVQVKWNSAISGSSSEYRFQGIVVEQDLNNIVRFDLASGSPDLYFFSATFQDGFALATTKVRANLLIPGGAGVQPLYMRVVREGNIWSGWYSTTGATWILAARFRHPLAVSSVGLFCGNSGSAPASFTSIVDYFHTTPTSTDVETSQAMPAAFALEQNYPNPFNPATVIRYQIPALSPVKLVVYDLLGREVSVLVNERKAAGSYGVSFDAAGLSSGVYFCRMEAGSFRETRKLLLVR